MYSGGPARAIWITSNELNTGCTTQGTLTLGASAPSAANERRFRPISHSPRGEVCDEDNTAERELLKYASVAGGLRKQVSSTSPTRGHRCSNSQLTDQ